MGTEQFTIMNDSFTAIKGDILSAVAIIAPVAVTIMSIIIIWVFAVNFFKRIGK